MPTDEAAIREAELGAHKVASQKVRSGEPIRSECFELTRADGGVIKTIPLRSVVIMDDEDA